MSAAAAWKGGFGASRPRAPRLATLFAVVAAHLVTLLLLLAGPERVDIEAAEARLATFDVPPPMPPPTPAPPEPERLPAPRPGAVNPGGSPGIRRERAARMVDRPRPPERAAIDTTPMWDAVPMPASAIDAGTAALDLGRGGEDGVGTGDGPGRGAGGGSGSGGDGVVYARADWIRRPTDDEWARAWPRRVSGTRMDETVAVILGCHVRADGKPHRCITLRTVPDRPAFGRAAIALVAGSRVRPVRRNGSDAGLPVFIPVTFYRSRPAAPEAHGVNVQPAPSATAAASAPPAPARP